MVFVYKLQLYLMKRFLQQLWLCGLTKFKKNKNKNNA